MFLTARDKHGIVIDEAEFTVDDAKVVRRTIDEVTCRGADGNVWTLRYVEAGDDEARYMIDSSTAGAYHGVVVEVEFISDDEDEMDDILAGRK